MARAITRDPVVRFVGVFAMLMGGFYFFSVSELFREDVYGRHLPWLAEQTGTILRALQVEVSVEGNLVSSQSFGLRLLRGCDSILSTAMLVSLIAAFPARWPAKALGALVGSVVLLLCNFMRTTSMVLVGTFYPAWFQVVHVDFWQAAFILLTIGCFLLWMEFALRLAKREEG